MERGPVPLLTSVGFSALAGPVSIANWFLFRPPVLPLSVDRTFLLDRLNVFICRFIVDVVDV